MKPRGIKLFWTLGAALIAAVIALGLLCPWLFPSSEVSPLYRKYANNPHLETTFLRNYPVNDSISVDVNTLSARDSIGWEILKKDFNIPVLPDIVLSVMDKNKDFILTYKASDDYKDMYDEKGIDRLDVIALAYIGKSVSIFHTRTESEQIAVLKYNIEISTSSKHQKKTTEKEKDI